MGRQEGGGNSLASLASLEASCSCTSREEQGGPVCGTDGQTYRSVCGLKTRACNMVRRQGESGNLPGCLGVLLGVFESP